MRTVLSVLALLVDLAGGVQAADPPKAAKPGCVCTDGCKCQGACPGSCPTEISYAEAVAAAQRGERVTVFYQTTSEPKNVAGKWAHCPGASPSQGPGVYVTRREESGRWGVDPVRLLVSYATPQLPPARVFGGVRLPGNFGGS